MYGRIATDRRRLNERGRGNLIAMTGHVWPKMHGRCVTPGRRGCILYREWTRIAIRGTLADESSARAQHLLTPMIRSHCHTLPAVLTPHISHTAKLWTCSSGTSMNRPSLGRHSCRSGESCSVAAPALAWSRKTPALRLARQSSEEPCTAKHQISLC
jgi:hypothetical protein